MRILQIAKYHPENSGGIETVVRNLSEGLCRKSHEVDILCFSNSGSKKQSTPYKVISFNESLNIYSNPVSLKHLMTLKKIVNHYDVIHVHSPHPLPEILLVHLDIKVPLIVTVHSDVKDPKPLALLYNEYHKQLLAKARFITVASENNIKFMSHLEDFKDKVQVIPFGTESFYTSTDNFSSETYFLFVGRLVRYKGLDVLLHAMQDIPLKLKIVGTGASENKLKALADNLKISDRIEFLGSKTKAELKQLYSNAQFLVLPSINKKECFGMVLIEALSTGLPLITTDLKTGVNSVNVNEVTGFWVPPKSVKELNQKIKQLASNPALRSYFSKNAFEVYKENYTLDKMVKSFEKLYKNSSRKKSPTQIQEPPLF